MRNAVVEEEHISRRFHAQALRSENDAEKGIGDAGALVDLGHFALAVLDRVQTVLAVPINLPGSSLTIVIDQLGELVIQIISNEHFSRLVRAVERSLNSRLKLRVNWWQVFIGYKKSNPFN